MPLSETERHSCALRFFRCHLPDRVLPIQQQMVREQILRSDVIGIHLAEFFTLRVRACLRPIYSSAGVDVEPLLEPFPPPSPRLGELRFLVKREARKGCRKSVALWYTSRWVHFHR